MVKVTEGIHLFVPNIFTPNGDGINDDFMVSTVLIVSLHTEIYDRWGKLVFETDNLSFKWPGKDILGENCPEGGYTYVMRGHAYNGQSVERSGIVLLTR
jgi:gliding motility-associated-like protein